MSEMQVEQDIPRKKRTRSGSDTSEGPEQQEQRPVPVTAAPAASSLSAGASQLAAVPVTAAPAASSLSAGASQLAAVPVTAAPAASSLSAGASQLAAVPVTAAPAASSLSAGASQLAAVPVTAAPAASSLSAGASQLAAVPVTAAPAASSLPLSEAEKMRRREARFGSQLTAMKKEEKVKADNQAKHLSALRTAMKSGLTFARSHSKHYTQGAEPDPSFIGLVNNSGKPLTEYLTDKVQEAIVNNTINFKENGNFSFYLTDHKGNPTRQTIAGVKDETGFKVIHAGPGSMF